MPNFVFAASLSTLLVIYSRRKKSLSPNGAAGAFVLGIATFSSTFSYFTAVLLVFFLTGSKLTKFKAERKRLLESDYEQASERTLVQVVCNALTGGVLVILFQLYFESQGIKHIDDALPWSKVIVWAYMGHYACCAGDTWASELGILNTSWPISVIRWKPVPPGTNGGVSLLGLGASIAGGATVGLAGATALMVKNQSDGFAWDIVLLGALAGLIGSLLDSVLGATVQKTVYSKEKGMVLADQAEDPNAVVISGWDILDNHQVNFVSSLLTSVLCGAAAYQLS